MCPVLTSKNRSDGIDVQLQEGTDAAIAELLFTKRPDFPYKLIGKNSSPMPLTPGMVLSQEILKVPQIVVKGVEVDVVDDVPFRPWTQERSQNDRVNALALFTKTTVKITLFTIFSPRQMLTYPSIDVTIRAHQVALVKGVMNQGFHVIFLFYFFYFVKYPKVWGLLAFIEKIPPPGARAVSKGGWGIVCADALARSSLQALKAKKKSSARALLSLLEG